MKTEWVVRVVAGNNPQNLPAPPAGHLFYPLVLINRKAANSKITFDMLTDLRRLHLTLAASAKAPLELYGPLGNLVFTLDNFANMLDLTSKGYFDLLRSDIFMAHSFATATPLESASVSSVFNEVTQTAQAASLQAKIRVLNNGDGIKVLENLYNAQDHFVTIITPLVAANALRVDTASLLTRLRQLLDGALGVPGLKPSAITNPNLSAAIAAQQEINREIGNRTQLLPHGRLQIRFSSGPPPATIIAAGATFRYQFDVTYERTTPGPIQTEKFDILPALNPPGWTVSVVGNPLNQITLQTEDTTTIAIDVTIPAVTAVNSAALNLQVRSQLNPTEMNTTNSEVSMTIGASSAQPGSVHVDLTSPAINVATDTIAIGRGGPTGLPGKAKSLRFKFSSDEIVGAPVDYNVTFASLPAGAFEAIADVVVKLGGVEGQEKSSDFSVIATAISVNGTLGTLTAKIAKAADANVSAQQVINLRVQKS